jgi:hypothetical protein
MTPIKTLRENPHIEAYLADFLMVIAWGVLFMCIGRATCAPRNAALAAQLAVSLGRVPEWQSEITCRMKKPATIHRRSSKSRLRI